MNKTALSSFLMALSILAVAQVPESFNYQVVVRDGVSNNPLTNQDVSFRMSILKGSSSGESQYSELHSANTGALGVVNLVIGNGTDKSGDLASIDWGADTYYLKVEIDKTGGSSYVEMGTTQLLTVPYAMYAKTADYNSLLNKPTIINSQWTSSGSDIYYNAGKVGIGTNPGDYILTVDGRATLLPGEDGTAGILYKTAENNNIGFIGAAGNDRLGIWGSGGGGFGLVMDVTSLNVGIGTSAPATKLEVNGIITASGANFTGTTTVPAPVNSSDAANKAYVDELLKRIVTLETLTFGFEDERDGHAYHAVLIGDQIWMTENLKYLPSVVGPGTGSTTTPYYYVYQYDGTDADLAKSTHYYEMYGVLYNWPAAMQGESSSAANPSGVQGVCPAGWHLPSDAEWTELTNFLGGVGLGGGALKVTGTTVWEEPNTGATNETGFTALPGGVRDYYNGIFGYLRQFGYWWSTTEDDATYAWCRYMTYDSGGVIRVQNVKSTGYSVRCLKD